MRRSKCPARGSGGERKPAGKCTGQDQKPRPRGRGGRAGGLRRGRLFPPTHRLGRGRAAAPALSGAAGGCRIARRGRCRKQLSPRGDSSLLYRKRGKMQKRRAAKGRRLPPAEKRQSGAAGGPLAPGLPAGAGCPGRRREENLRVGRRSLSGRKKQGLDKQRKRGYSEYTPPRGRGVRRF